MTNFINKLFNSNKNSDSSASSPANSQITTNLSDVYANSVQSGDIINNNSHLNQNEIVERVVLSEHGFNLAARSAGDPALLRSSLNRIYHGHLVDINQNETDQILHKQLKEKEMAELDKQKAELEAEKNNIQNNYIPLKEASLKEQREKIHDLKINRAEQQQLSEYNLFWFTAYVILCVLMCLFLFFFYANVMYNAFFRNILQDIVGSNTDDIGLMLNALFTEKLFEQKAMTLFQVFLAASLFFGFGLLPHKILHDKRFNKTWSKRIGFVATIGVALLIEILLAKKVHSNIELVKSMIYNDDQFKHVPFYASGMFYTIVIMGFGVYMVWAYFLELAIEMHQKRDTGKIVKLHIDKINDVIAGILQEISQLKTRLCEIEASIQKNRISHSQIKQMINARIFDKALLKRNIEQFYGGWLKHLSSAEHLNIKIQECEKVYADFVTGIDKLDKPATTNFSSITAWFMLLWLGLTGGYKFVNAKHTQDKLNVLIVLDLSDRLLNEKQFEADSTIIMAVFNNFYHHVQLKNIYIKSNDCFRIVAAPQAGTSKLVNGLLDKLYLNMAETDMAKRKAAINNFKQQLPVLIRQLYMASYRGSKTNNYPGCDIWQYVNEQLQTDIAKNSLNKVVFVTDGYMDFENGAHSLKQGNLSTNTHFIKKLNGINWKQQAVQKGYGILPVKHYWHNAQVLVAGICSKQQSNLTEIDKLNYFWGQWLSASGFKQFSMVNMASPAKMAQLINQFFNL